MDLNYILASPAQKNVHNQALKVLERYAPKDKIEEQIASLRKVDKDGMLSTALKGMPSISRIRMKLDKAGMDIGVQTYLIWMGVTFVLSNLILMFLFGAGIIAALIFSLLLSHLIPNFIVNRKINKRMKKFIMLLPDALDLAVRGLRSGLPVTESINVISEEIEDPVKSIFAEIANSAKMGVPFEEALYKIAKKLDLNEFNFFVISIALQRETGGNLAEILENLSETIRARAMMKLKIKALSSEARMSSYIVGALPFLVSIALVVISPGYLDPLLDTVGGNISLGVACSMFVFGMFVMRKMGDFEI